MARVFEWDNPYTAGEETANAVSHIVGSHLGAAMTAILCYAAYLSGVDVAWKIVSGCVFGFSCIFLLVLVSLLLGYPCPAPV